MGHRWRRKRDRVVGFVRGVGFGPQTRGVAFARSVRWGDQDRNQRLARLAAEDCYGLSGERRRDDLQWLAL